MRKIHRGEFLYHFLLFIFFAYTFNFDIGPAPSRITYAGPYKFYTFWNVCLAVAYYAIASAVDLSHLTLSDQLHGIRKTRDYIFCSLVIPSATVVAVAFWGLYFIDSELILPEWQRKFTPVNGFYNHAVHTVPILAIVLEMLIVFHVPASSFFIGCSGGLLYGMMYAIWVHWLAYMPGGFWTYPFLQVFSVTQRVVFFLVQFVVGFVVYYISVRLIKAIWHEDMRAVEEKKKI